MNTVYITQSQGYLFLLAFGIVMIVTTLLFERKKQKNSAQGFLLADRNVGWFSGGVSIAASWIWAPALFVSVQLAYEKGLAGIFWFTVPNVIALALFAVLAPRIRKLMPDGYTLPQYINHRLQSEVVRRIYLFPFFLYQIMAITVQLFVGGNLLTLLTGIPLAIVMPLLACVALAYSLLSGLRASVVTDVIQMALIVGIGGALLPFTWHVAGGFSAIAAGFHGIENIGSMLDPGIAFSLGIVTSIGLLSGVISDQQYWQRAFALRKKSIVKAFVFGALLFGIVPLALSTLGFIAANPDMQIVLPAGVDISMIGVQAVAQLLPGWALMLFVIMLLAGLSSTLDSGLSAVSSLWVTDVKESDDATAVRSARFAMVGFMILGLAIAYAIIAIPPLGLFHLWWIFNAVAATIAVPTVLSLYSKRFNARGAAWGIVSAIVIGLPLFIYANIKGDNAWIVGVSICIVVVSAFFSVTLQERVKKDD